MVGANEKGYRAQNSSGFLQHAVETSKRYKRYKRNRAKDTKEVEAFD
jgi:hypothetical protein